MTGVVSSNFHRYQPHRNRCLPLSGMTIFCDFDGPIVDVSDRYYSTYQLGLADTQAIYQAQGKNLPIHILSKVQFWKMKQDRVPDIEIAMRSGLHQEQIEIFLQRVNEIVNQPTLLCKDRLQPGVQWALALLHSQGARLVLVTLRCETQATQILQNYGLARLFSRICGTKDQHAAYWNNTQQKIQLLAQVLTEQKEQGFHPEAAWMIGDTEADILAGQSVEIPTIALVCGIRSYKKLEQFSPTLIHHNLLSAAHQLTGSRQLAQV